MVAAAAAAVLALLFLFAGRTGTRRRAAERLASMRRPRGAAGEGLPGNDGARASILEKLVRALPAGVRKALSRGLEEHAVRAGRPVEHLAGMRAACSVAAPALVLAASGFSPIGVVVAPAGAALGYALPRLLASRGYRRRLDSLRAALPAMADMLYTSVLGGRNLDQAFRAASSTAREPLGAHLLTTVAEMDLGASHEEAFGRLLERCPLPELDSLLRSLLESEKRGYPVSHVLEVFSRDIRARSRDELRAAAARAPVRLLAPLVFLVLPASVILTVGPTFLVALRRGL